MKLLVERERGVTGDNPCLRQDCCVSDCLAQAWAEPVLRGIFLNVCAQWKDTCTFIRVGFNSLL